MEIEKTKKRDSPKGNDKKAMLGKKEQVLFPEKLKAANKTLKQVGLPKLP